MYAILNRLQQLPVIGNPNLWAAGNLLILLYGVLLKGWNLQPIVFIFWIEVIINIAIALVRVIFAHDKQPFLATLPSKVGALLFGGVMGIAFIMLTVTFSIGVFEGGFKSEGFEQVPWQVRLLVLNYLLALLLHYFLNKRYLIANPAEELMGTFMYLLILLALLMVLTQFLIPKVTGSSNNIALLTGMAVVVVKFMVDRLKLTLQQKTQNLPG
ncbi:hypothetical protein C7N43_19385 [Sphingobacteriales bacterium UPWRP_1]|nr:hypothetical protein BVG80_13715 [Sphingobacteriales bacterium TSM_CSM]PSJ75380.1 hypothetical protein C7N43_19385 [Sphingobacteriales bacterium UPWRP_1]